MAPLRPSELPTLMVGPAASASFVALLDDSLRTARRIRCGLTLAIVFICILYVGWEVRSPALNYVAALLSWVAYNLAGVVSIWLLSRATTQSAPRALRVSDVDPGSQGASAQASLTGEQVLGSLHSNVDDPGGRL